jgi:hypothetical protein
MDTYRHELSMRRVYEPLIMRMIRERNEKFARRHSGMRPLLILVVIAVLQTQKERFNITMLL